MTAYVRNLKIDSGNPYSVATIVVARQWVFNRPPASDLPADVRTALLAWLLSSPDDGDPRRPIDSEPAK